MSSSRSQFPIYTDRETGITYPYGHKLNPVGTRWMGLAMGDGYGIHGTQEEETIGQSKSKGCVRMYQHDLEELFDLTLTGDQVLITEE
jgi:lipoprotein-anchoring transpeptidase ErfK/SrfK